MRGKSLLLIYLTTLFFIATTAVNVQSSPELPRIIADPPVIIDTGLGPGGKFTISIKIADVTDMWAFGIKVRWSSPLLDVTDDPGTLEIVEGVTAGTFLQMGGDTRFIAKLDQNEGTLSVASTLLSGGTPQSGDGTLFTVEFTVQGVGATALDLYDTGVNVKGPPPDYMPTPTEHTHEDGFFANSSGYDITVTDAVTSKTVVGIGFSVSITVNVQNKGSIPETFVVNAYYDSKIAATQMVTLSNGASTSLTLTFSTTGVAKGNYIISATAMSPGDANPNDNTYTDGSVRVSIIGDIKETFGIVDIFDVVTVAKVFGSEKGSPEYNPNADINGDNIIDIFDVVHVSKHFGEEDP